MSPNQKRKEYDRARVIRLLSDGKQTQFIGAAAKGSLFTGHELLAMIDRFPRDWSESDLWKLLLCAVDGKGPKLANPLKVNFGPSRDIRRQLQRLGKSQRELARMTGVARSTLERFLRGEMIGRRTMAKLENWLETEAVA